MKPKSYPIFTSSTQLGCLYNLFLINACSHVDRRYTPITEDDYSRDVFALFYGHNAPAALDESQSHKLGLLFLVFAMGKLMDLRESPTNTQEAMRYYQIGRAALTIEPVLEARSIYAIQALVSCDKCYQRLVT